MSNKQSVTVLLSGINVIINTINRLFLLACYGGDVSVFKFWLRFPRLRW